MRYDGQEFEAYVATHYLSKQQHCKDSSVEFQLTLTEFRNILKRKTCAYSGMAMTHGGAGQKTKQARFSDVTLERKDNSRGYTKDNVVAVAYGFNNLKSKFENPTCAATIKHLKNFIKAI